MYLPLVLLVASVLLLSVVLAQVVVPQGNTSGPAKLCCEWKLVTALHQIKGDTIQQTKQTSFQELSSSICPRGARGFRILKCYVIFTLSISFSSNWQFVTGC